MLVLIREKLVQLLHQLLACHVSCREVPGSRGPTECEMGEVSVSGVVRSSKHNYEQQLTESSVSAPVQSRVQVDVVIAGAVRLDRGERAAAAAVGVVVVN